MLINGNRLVELTQRDLEKLRELLDREQAEVQSGIYSPGGWTAIELRELAGRIDY